MDLIFETVYANAHRLNIYLHIGFGSLAICLGLMQLVNKKGGDLHRNLGRLFLKIFCVVIVTAIFGVFIFEFRSFLAVLTLSAGYAGLSGYRVLVLRGRRPRKFDNVAAVLCLIACLAFVFAVEHFQLTFSKPTIYATLVSLGLICIYDAARNFLPVRFLKHCWLNEHIVKMMSALSGLLSAASGNLLPNFGALSQLAPVFVCSLLMLIFLTLSNPSRRVY